MARDGLMPKMFGKVHPKYHTPYIGTIIVGVLAAVLAGLLPVGFLGDIVSMGTLLAFAVVSIGVLILRFTRPNLPRPFRVPLAIVICPLGFLSRSEEHTSELQSLMRISYAVFCLKKTITKIILFN